MCASVPVHSIVVVPSVFSVIFTLPTTTLSLRVSLTYVLEPSSFVVAFTSPTSALRPASVSSNLASITSTIFSALME